MNKGMFAPRGISLSETMPMQLDRRKITNGLAWAGAALIVAIPAADLIARQFSSEPVQQVAIVEQETQSPAAELPTASTERPATTPAAPAANTTSTPKPAVTPAASASSGDAVDDFLQSGRELPSYISGGGSTPASAPAPAPIPAPSPPSVSQPTQTASLPAQQTQPIQPAATQPARPQITPPRAVIGFPTPVSERPRIATAPAPVNPAPVVQPASPPLIIENSGPVVTAQDLEDWETGPLSDFLANRGGQGQAQPPANYDGNGFWLDQGPNTGRNNQFPQAYDDYYYPYGQ